MAVVVQRLAVDGHDDGETHGAVALPGLALHEAGQLVLIAARHRHLHGADMHVVGGGDGFLDFLDFLGTLDAALLDTGLDEVHGGIAKDGVEFDAEQHAHLPLVVGAVGWEVVDAAGFADGFVAEGLEDGVPANPKKAKEWYKKAAAAGYDPAAAALSRMK